VLHKQTIIILSLLTR